MKAKIKRMFDLRRMPNRLPKMTRAFLLFGTLIVFVNVFNSLGV